jgi:hypothetical protein
VPRRFLDHTPYGSADDRFELLPPEHELLDGQSVIGWDVEPGDVLAFHFRTLHGAPGNQLSTSRRRAVSLRWLGDDARFGERPWTVSPPYEPDGWWSAAPSTAIPGSRSSSADARTKPPRVSRAGRRLVMVVDDRHDEAMTTSPSRPRSTTG